MIDGDETIIEGEGQPPHIHQGSEEPKQYRTLEGFEDIALLGLGGMGEVRRIRDPDLNCYLAMKIMHQRMSFNQENILRFQQEAQILSQLQHPNIPPIHKLGMLADGRPYFTMREIQGRSFSDIIYEVHRASDPGAWRTTKDGWTFRKMITAFQQACEAVAYAHSKGVLHRDLKPANIMIGNFGEVLVVDWGLAKLVNIPEREYRIGDKVELSQPLVTIYGRIQGTPSYMSPEQAAGQELDHYSDIYSLGAILYQILSSQPPYKGGTANEILSQLRQGPPVPIHTVHTEPDLKGIELATTAQLEISTRMPNELITACERAMHRDRYQRFDSAHDLSQTIQDWLDGVKAAQRGRELVKQANETKFHEERLRKESKKMRLEAEMLSSQLKPHHGEEIKSKFWQIEDQAIELERQAEHQKAIREQLLQGALTHKADLFEAHVELAEYYKQLHTRAENERDEDALRRTESRLRYHVSSLPDNSEEAKKHVRLLERRWCASVCIPIHQALRFCLNNMSCVIEDS